MDKEGQRELKRNTHGVRTYGPTEAEWEKTATPKQRQRRQDMEDMLACERANPIDHGPIWEAVERGDIEDAICLAMNYGLRFGVLTGLFGEDAVKGRALLLNMEIAREAKKATGQARHADWQAGANMYWENDPDLTQKRVAELVHDQIQGDKDKTGYPKFVPTAKAIENIIKKPKKESRG